MEINSDVCNGCGQCILVCPVQAIKMIDNKAYIDEDCCVECAVCIREAKCPVNAIMMKRLQWPRSIRIPFSNVLTTHKLTGIGGRGTEEMKTNDVTNRYNAGEIGIAIELGRPGVGTKLRNIELFTTKLSVIGVIYEEKSPVTTLIIDGEGHINEEIKEERVLSAIIEFKIPSEKLPLILNVIRTVENEIDTVFTVGLVSRMQGINPSEFVYHVTNLGFQVRPNAKINIGLGKP